MRNKKGFTLVELLAVIVILAIILVIAVPQVLRVIDQSRRDSLRSSVRMYASAIETDYLVSMASDNPPAGTVPSGTTCPNVVKFENGACTYALSVVDNVPTATVTIVGSGNFSGLTATGTKTGTVTVTDTET